MDLSVEEANKIRVAMGMKPLPVPGANNADNANAGPAFKQSNNDGSDDDPASTLETRQAQGYDNWKRLQDDAAAKAKREAQKAAIKKAKEMASRFALLQGKGLADEEDDLDDKAWLMSSKKRQKKIEKARKLQEELEERERQAEAAIQYTEKDLAGVKVAHELDKFGEGDEIIVNLKDTAVDADDDDELEATVLKEAEKLKERLDSKKRKRVYDPNDIDEAGQGSILAQYDEEIDGKKRKVFTLDGQGRTVEEAEMGTSAASKPRKMTISLDILKDDTPVNDYMDISEVKVKKPKKKKSKSTRKKAADDDDIFPLPEDVEMEDDNVNAALAKPKKSMFDESFVDDDDLQANLAQQRRAALKKRKKMRPEDLARQLREETSATPDVMETTEDGEEPGLVIDETTEFVANLQKPTTQQEKPSRKSSQPLNGTTSMGAPSPGAESDEDVEMEQSYHSIEEEQERAGRATRSGTADITATGLEDEGTLNKGIGSALTLLRQRGLVEETNSGDINAHYRERQRFLADKQQAESAAERQAREQRDKDRRSGRLDRMTPREREEYARRMNTTRDQMESRKLADIFNKEYKPNVELNYVDEFGRQMNQKEAFKHLSHQFHGKGSGNQKTQKHLHKIEGEKKRMAQSALDASQNTGMSNAQGIQSKKHKQAGVRLQ